MVGRRELLRRRAAGIVLPVDDEVGAQLGQRAAIDLGEAHLQHHLLALLAARELQHVDDFHLRRTGLRDLRGPQRDVVVRDAPDRMIASSVALTVMSSPGKQRAQLLLQRGDRWLDNEVVVLAIGAAPDDQADGAGRLAVDQNLAVLDDDGVGDRRVGDGDADDLEIGAQHRRSPGGQDDALDLPWQLRRRRLLRRALRPPRGSGCQPGACRRPRGRPARAGR